MANKQPERATFRHKWKLIVQRAWGLFLLAYLTISILSFVFLPPLMATVVSVLFLLAGALAITLMQVTMTQKNKDWLQQYGEPIQVPVRDIAKRKQYNQRRRAWSTTSFSGTSSLAGGPARFGRVT